MNIVSCRRARLLAAASGQNRLTAKRVNGWTVSAKLSRANTVPRAS
jgi:hypothetical protein